MEELELQLKGLKQIRADNDWAGTLKSELLAQKAQTRLDTKEARLSARQARMPTFSMPNIFNRIPSRAFLAVPALLFAFGLGLFYHNQNARYLEITAEELEGLNIVAEKLRTEEHRIVQETKGLESIHEPGQMLLAGSSVESTVEKAGKIVMVTKELTKKSKPAQSPPEMFTVLSNVEYAAEGIEYAVEQYEETYLIRQKELAEQEIRALEEKSLNQEQESLLEEAKDMYNRGDYEGALRKVQAISYINY